MLKILSLSVRPATALYLLISAGTQTVVEKPLTPGHID